MDFLEFKMAVEHSKKTDKFVKGRIGFILIYILDVEKLKHID